MDYKSEYRPSYSQNLFLHAELESPSQSPALPIYRKPVAEGPASPLLHGNNHNNGQGSTPPMTERRDSIGPSIQQQEEHYFPNKMEQEYQPEYPVPHAGTWMNDPPPPPPIMPVVKRRKRKLMLWWALRYFIVAAAVFVALLIPIIIFTKDALPTETTTFDDAHRTQFNNLVFWIFTWLEITWSTAVVLDLFGLILPYLFRFIARYVNSSHQRYWRILKLLRRPICFFGTSVISYIAFSIIINNNAWLYVNLDKDTKYLYWDDIITHILDIVILWTAFYLVEKSLIAYVTLHYHYRQHGVALKRTKDVRQALMKLYEASIAKYPVFGDAFMEEDIIIRNAKGNNDASARTRATTHAAGKGADGYWLLTKLFGNLISADAESRWLRPGSSYAVIERAWTNPRTASALVRRIWLPLTNSGNPLSEADVEAALGPGSAKEAARIYEIIDADKNGDVSFNEFEDFVVDAGKTMHNIFANIANMDHCINSFDWLLILVIATVMTFFIVVQYVPAVKEIQTVLSSLAVGLSFAIGRTLHHLLTGIIFVFFDHPFDHGDVVVITNAGSDVGTSCTVKQQSLLYTVFEKRDDKTDLQIANETLSAKCIQNLTRSGLNRQNITMSVDFGTTFKDVAKLRDSLDRFLRENPREYIPESLSVNVTSLHDLNKMELKIAFTHRNNWSNSKLRAKRSNMFYCNLVSVCRMIPICKPGGLKPSSGSNGNPTYTVALETSMELADNIAKEKTRRQGLRWDEQKVKTEVEKQQLTEEEVAKIQKEEDEKRSEDQAFRAMASLPKIQLNSGTTTSFDNVNLDQSDMRRRA